MTDIRLKQSFTVLEPQLDWFLTDAGTLDEREELATAIRVALGTDALASFGEVLPDLDSTDRRGWWGDFETELIWGGWPIGCKNWLLTRAKITQAPAAEGSTVERARIYTLAAMQPFIDRRVATSVTVNAARQGLDRIVVQVVLFRGPLPEIDLRFQLLWTENVWADD